MKLLQVALKDLVCDLIPSRFVCSPVFSETASFFSEKEIYKIVYKERNEQAKGCLRRFLALFIFATWGVGIQAPLESFCSLCLKKVAIWN